MGTRGRKPSVEKALSTRETYTPTGIPGGVQRPADLTEPAAEIWDVLLDDLTAMGVFRPADSIILVEVCEMIAEAKRLRRSLDRPNQHWPRFERELDRGEADEIIADPATAADLWPLSGGYKRLRTAYLQTMRTAKSYIDEFGITPVARLRLGLLQLQGQGLASLFTGDDDSDVAPAALDGTFTEL